MGPRDFFALAREASIRFWELIIYSGFSIAHGWRGSGFEIRVESGTSVCLHWVGWVEKELILLSMAHAGLAQRGMKTLSTGSNLYLPGA